MKKRELKEKIRKLEKKIRKLEKENSELRSELIYVDSCMLAGMWEVKP